MDSNGSSMPIDGYGYPGQVPGERSRSGQATSYALRFQLTSQSYDQAVQRFDGFVQQGKVTVKPYQPENVSSVMGVMVKGEVEQDKQGSMIIIPLRDKTLKVWTEAKQFESDFKKYILPNLLFEP